MTNKKIKERENEQREKDLNISVRKNPSFNINNFRNGLRNRLENIHIILVSEVGDLTLVTPNYIVGIPWVILIDFLFHHLWVKGS